MKSVTIRDKYDKVLIKIVHRKSGKYEVVMERIAYESGVTVEIRDDKGKKVLI